MRTIASIFIGIGGIILLLGAFKVLNLDNFDPTVAGLGFSAISVAISLFWKVWVQPN